ncbi:MAG: CHAT domain-containing protein [Oceanospirillaceae bacterium]|uniref:CHAT domain-containing protein n=1 Tax=Salipiger sp. HF18 TaxID=2721557 RepID=UPI00142E2BDA|nr:CHAT domain-containing protein [Salipiger sp. HF18]NIY95769.1 CHAT domain-containing protein [Salipiger sp. HF18]NVK42383.1 CHAT domain-containing protein [Oceanospirillaceae bacterium]
MPTLPDISIEFKDNPSPAFVVSWGGEGRSELSPVTRYDAFEQEAADLYHYIATHLGQAALSMEALRSDPIAESWISISNKILGSILHPSRNTIRSAIEDVLQSIERRPIYAQIDARLAHFPWELLRLRDDTLLGDEIVFFSDFQSGFDGHSFHTQASRTSNARILIKAIEESDIPYAANERRNLTLLASNAMEVQFAPEIDDIDGRKDFFQWIGAAGYDGLHFYCHCRYPPEKFEVEIEVSNNATLTLCDLRADLMLDGSAFAVLNVCEAGPSPENRGGSFVEYLALEQGIGAIVATLAPARADDAAHFANEFYVSWLGRVGSIKTARMGEALFRVRQELLNDNLLTAHLYRIFGQADIYLEDLESKEKAA